jgi:phosphate transport system permease protein
MNTIQKELVGSVNSNEFDYRTEARHRAGKFWLNIFRLSTLIGILALFALLYNIVNDAFGYVALEYKVNPASLTSTGAPLETLEKADLAAIIEAKVSAGLLRQLTRDRPLTDYSKPQLLDIIEENILKPGVKETWPLFTSLFQSSRVINEAQANYPEAYLEFRSWLSWEFIVSPQDSDPIVAGIRTAILGTLAIISIVLVTAFPVGVGAAIYLEEYADTRKWHNRAIETNINNLAGVPSIIYGIVGLAVFVRALEPLTSGAIFGALDGNTTANGRTILAAGLTLTLLILPVIIINAREAIKAVPNSLREAAYAIGATKWQTIWFHVLPNALPGILTGTIIAISRAIGETAPLVVIGASTYITFDPENLFSKFTALPIQVYQWTTRPQDVWRSLAAASIIVLLILLLSLNGLAIYLRNRYSRRNW